MDKVICNLTENEKKEIEDIFEKKIALENLSKLPDIMSNEGLYNKLISDYGKTTLLFQKWWKKATEKYKLEGKEVRVDFETSQIIEELNS